MVSSREMLDSVNMLVLVDRQVTIEEISEQYEICRFLIPNRAIYLCLFQGQLPLGFIRIKQDLVLLQEQWKPFIILIGNRCHIFPTLHICPALMSTRLDLSKNFCVEENFQAIMR